MPEPITVVAAVASGIFVVFVVPLWATLRRRDPIGRAVTGHAVVLDAIRDSALRATKVAPVAQKDDRTPVSVVASPKRDGPPAA